MERETIEIIGVTMRMAICSTLLSSLLGVFLGFGLWKAKFPGKRWVVRLNRTLMGVPPVAMGLAVYLLLMRSGPLSRLNMLFTVRAMVFAQTLIIMPIICGMVYSSACRLGDRILAFGKTMGASPLQLRVLLVKEMKNEIYFAVITGFGRAVSEVGAVMIVGGNIQHKTRTMTTTITLLRNRGEYREAIVLGIILLAIAFLLQLAADFLVKEEQSHENI